MAPINKQKYWQWAMDACAEFGGEQTSSLRKQLGQMVQLLERFGFMKQEEALPLACLYFVLQQRWIALPDLQTRWGKAMLEPLLNEDDRVFLANRLALMATEVTSLRRKISSAGGRNRLVEIKDELDSFRAKILAKEKRLTALLKHLDFMLDNPLVDNELFVLILQHPQEPRHPLGSAKWIVDVLKKSQMLVGLSWPNLKKVLEKVDLPAPKTANEWGVLYLGSGTKEEIRRDQPRDEIYFTDKDGHFQSKLNAQTLSRGLNQHHGLKGVIVIDGTWSQAKTLWWRNPWLLKCQRLILNPADVSIYGEMRKEPRPECLSTLETTAKVLSLLGERPETPQALVSYFDAQLKSLS